MHTRRLILAITWTLATGYGLLALPGCSRAQARAKTVPEVPLDIPQPPPRDIEPVEVETPPAAAPAPAEPARSPAPTRPRPQPREQPRTEAPKVEPPKVEPPAAEPRTEDAGRTSTTLQTTPATAEGEMERAVRATLTRATTELNRIDYRRLNADARTQYDTAKRFVRQAGDAIRAKNLIFAKNLAEKADAIAAQLASR